MNDHSGGARPTFGFANAHNVRFASSASAFSHWAYSPKRGGCPQHHFVGLYTNLPVAST